MVLIADLRIFGSLKMFNKLDKLADKILMWLSDRFYKHWVAATLVAVFVAWFVAVYSKVSI